MQVAVQPGSPGREAMIVVPESGPAVALSRPGPRTGLCLRCGAVGTHYLTCKTLRLPPGYRVSGEYEPPLTRCLCGLAAGSCEVCA